MTREEMLLYAKRYKKTQTKITIILSIFIFSIAAILFVASLLLAIFQDGTWQIMVAIVIMSLLGFLDLCLGWRFLFFQRNKIRSMKDRDAAQRYCNIHGFINK